MGGRLGIAESRGELDALAASVADAARRRHRARDQGLGAPHWRDDVARIVGLNRASGASELARAVYEAHRAGRSPT